MTTAAQPLLGRWRSVAANLWDRGCLDLCGPAALIIRPHGDGEIAFGALQASLDVDYGSDKTGFTWQGCDERNEVSGSGSAELQDDGSLQIEFEYHNGDKAVLKAVRELSSTAC